MGLKSTCVPSFMKQISSQEFCDFVNAEWDKIPWLRGKVIDDDNLEDLFSIPNNKYLPKTDFVSLTDIEGYVVNEDGGSSVGIVTAFRKWRKARSSVMLFFEVPKEKESEVRAAVKALLEKI